MSRFSHYASKLGYLCSFFLFSSFIISSCTVPEAFDDNSAQLMIQLRKPASVQSLIASADLLITAADMDTISRALTVNDSMVYGQVQEVPSGIDRHFSISCYDADGDLSYAGSAVRDVSAGTVLDLTIILYPVEGSGTVIIHGEFYEGPDYEHFVVFSADYRGDYDVYLCDESGADIIPLSNSEGNDIYPKISPDGTAVVWIRSGGLPILFDLTKGTERTLPVPDDMIFGYASWNEDGSQLLMHGRRDYDPVTANDIFLYDLQTGTLSPLTESSWGENVPMTIPGTELIHYFSNEFGVYKHVIHELRTGERTQIYDNDTESWEERTTVCASNGKDFYASARNRYAQWGIFRKNIESGEFSEILNTQGVDEHYPCLSPDEDRIMFTHRSGDQYIFGIHITDMDGNQKVFIDREFYSEQYADWH